ncbi:RNA-binding protein Rsf1 [Copidosoma floridanum]|uniref:RNA-binding protein Rsf1 n=1 Tax=Copidosoma floridanum TaxID=29053 RepID=UPI0006C9782D|nr:RNA-binding protein Rsf1 [Copidosoma floridanum]XP_014216488.1 RNA-binding protein Rsf1 [Copidosoma floridanum]
MTPDGYARVYVGGLTESIKKEDLQLQFEKFGKLNKVWVAFNPPGFAFIEYFNMDEAESACSNMNGTEIMGTKLRVEISRGRGRGGRGGFKTRGPGRGGFGFRGGYRANNAAGGYEQDSYYSGRTNSSSGYYNQHHSAPSFGYGAPNSYNQDGYNGNDGSSYYSGRNTRDTRYRSRSPAGRVSQRHLRECT